MIMNSGELVPLIFCKYKLLLQFLVAVYKISCFFLYRVCVKKDYLNCSRSLFLTSDYKRRRNGICAFMEVQGDLTKKDLEKLAQNVLVQKEFTQCIAVDDFVWPHFVPPEEGKFQYSNHVYEYFIEHGTYEEMMVKANDIVNLRYDLGKPLWSIHVIRNYVVKKEKKSMFVLNIHHALLDGFSAVKLLFAITKKANSGENENWLTKMGKVRRKRKKLSMWFKLKMFCKGLFKMTLSAPDDKRQYFATSRPLQTDDTTPYVMWKDGVSLADCKIVTKHYGFSINDFVMSAVAGGVRKFLKLKGTEFDAEMMEKEVEFLRGTSWVNLGTQSFPDMLKSCCKEDSYVMTEKDFDLKIGAVGYPLPVHIENDLKRMRYTHKVLKGLLFSPEAPLSGFIFKILGALPAKFLPPIFNVISAKPSTSFSNVPGPQHKRLLCGKQITRVIFCSFPVGGMSEMMHMFSYDGKLYFSVCGLKMKKDMELLVECIKERFLSHIDLALRASFLESERQGLQPTSSSSSEIQQREKDKDE